MLFQTTVSFRGWRILISSVLCLTTDVNKLLKKLALHQKRDESPVKQHASVEELVDFLGDEITDKERDRLFGKFR